MLGRQVPWLGGTGKYLCPWAISFGDMSAHAGTVDNFTLTNAAVPEPTGLVGLLALPALALGARRRRVRST